MTSILLPIDGSEASLHACRLVAGYAGDASALRITLLNVQRPPLRLSPHPVVSDDVLEEGLHEQGESELEAALALLRAAGQSPEPLVRIGAPADTILAVARETAADVVVMGNGRHGPLRGYAVGSVALRVAPAAQCPVVLVRPGARLPAEAGRALRVAAPVDGSPESLRAVQRLAECRGFLGRLHVDLVHFHPGLSLAAAIMPPHDDVLQEWSGREANAALDASLQVLAAAGIPHVVHRLAGAPDVEIAAFAESHGADLIAMGTRGMGAMHHLLLGSVALKTALASNVPLALMR
ncbi:MAG: universal stress protein [Ramlibacter sp.]